MAKKIISKKTDKPVKKTYASSRMAKKKMTKAAVNRSASEWWEAEARKKKGMELCERCEAVYFEGHWHTVPALSAVLSARGGSARGGKAPGAAGLCKQCHWAVHGSERVKAGFEGQVTLDGLKDPVEKAEILAAVRNFAHRAALRDPEDQIIAIDDRGERVIIATTENQLAVGIGKAVAAAFKGGKLRIAWSDDDLPARVHWKHK